MITDPAELLNLLDLDPSLATQIPAFPLRVPRGFVARMKKGDLNDPLLRQVLPIGQELSDIPGFVADPLGEQAANPQPGLLHKYHGRVLLIVAGTCGINCRYCFRREFAYDENHLTSETLQYIQQDSSIREVILSGGDPLVISDRRLKLFVEQISVIPHVKTLRIHSRMPVVSPERITDELLDCLSHSRLRTVLVLHTNHPQEIDPSVEAAIKRVRDANITVLNQSVLLRGINDSVETLVALSERLFDIGVLPYYLHLLDKVQGSAHFEVDKQTAKAIVLGMMEQLPGYLVPRLVLEEAGKKSKTPVM